MKKTLFDLMSNMRDTLNLTVVKDGQIVAYYDGRDSIPECYNDCELIRVSYDCKRDVLATIGDPVK